MNQLATKSKNLSLRKLIHKYSWLKIITTVENYVEPTYYDNLLKPYIFSGKTDLEIFSDFLKKNIKTRNKQVHALELGCGNGRATRIFLDTIKYNTIDLVDLSPRMIKTVKQSFSENKNTCYITSDSVDYLEKTTSVYDIVFSLWSFSHSVHQVLTKFGINKGTLMVKSALKKIVIKNMEKGSLFFLIHFDSLSDEQRILIKQWKKVFPIFNKNTQQSPSKLIVDKVLGNLDEEGIIKFSPKHYIGKPIKYDSLDKALETFMNFHMESYFNTSPLCEQVVDELSKYLQQFKRNDGKIYIKPGCYIYTFTKII